MTTNDYNRCVDGCADGLYRFLLGIVRTDVVAQDIVQESFTRLWENRKKVETSKARSYLFTIAYNLAMSELRVRQRRPSEEFSIAHYATDTPYDNLTEILYQLLDTLTETQRSVIMLCDWEGYSYQEITEITGLSLPNVKSYIHRTRNLIKERLEDEYRN